MHVLGDQDVVKLLTGLSAEGIRDILGVLHDVLSQYTRSVNLARDETTIFQPEREVITTKLNNTTLFMPSSITTVTGIKVVTLPSGQSPRGSINIFEPTGELKGVLSAGEITAFRTALTIMIVYQHFKRTKQHILIFGAGRQAEWHIRLALLLGDVSHVTIVNRSANPRIEALFTELRKDWSKVEFDSLTKDSPKCDEQLREALKSSDVIFGCTPSTTPLFPHSSLKGKTRFIGLIGSYKPNMQEVDSETILSGDCIYVDSKSACLVEAGELIMANVQESQLREVGELASDVKLNEQRNIVFKCVGLGIMDIAVGSALLEQAKRQNLGTEVDF